MGFLRDLIHEDDEFAHNGSESNLGGFSGGAEALVKLFEAAIGACADQSGHVESPPDWSAAATDGSSSMPLAAIPGVGSQACQSGGLVTVERSQFRKFGQHSHGCDHPNTFDGLEFFHACIQQGSLAAKLFEQGFYLSQIGLQAAQKLSGLLFEAGHRQAFHLLTLGDEEIEQLHPAANQFGQLLFLMGAWGSGFRLKFSAVIGQDNRIDVVGFGVLTCGPSEVTDPGWIEYTHRKIALMKGGDDFTFVTPSGFTDNLHGGEVRQEFEQPTMARGSVGQVMDAIGQMQLQVLLGNIQATINSGHSVLALSCKYELALVGRSINGSSLGHRDGRLLLPAHTTKSRCQRVTSSSAPLSCRLQAAGQIPLTKSSFQDKVRGNLRYKRGKFCRAIRLSLTSNSVQFRQHSVFQMQNHGPHFSPGVFFAASMGQKALR